jgi:hypothetical protein
MKKILIVLAVASIVLIGCRKEETPTPAVARSQQQTTPTAAAPPLNVYNFNGTWNCDNWVVDQMTNTTAVRQIIFTNQDTTYVSMSMNEYSSTGSLINMFVHGEAITDSNYFDNPLNVIPLKFKGVMTTDSTMMIYEYRVSASGVVDTTQFKEFKKD